MGWLGAVDVTHAVARRLFFHESHVSQISELRKDRDLPEGDVSFVCMDGFDYIQGINILGDMFDSPSTERSTEMEYVIATCRQLGLPSNVSKQLV